MLALKWGTLFSLFLLTLLLQGCGGTAAVNSQHTAAAPAWTLNPEKPGYVSAVGSAMPQEFGGDESQRRVAMLKARQELAQTIRVRITSMFATRIEERNGEVTSDYAMKAELKSKVLLTLEHAQVVREWRDPANGMLYLWLAVPEGALK